LKIDHPSFFHSFCSTRDGAGFLPDGAPSSLSGSAGTVSALPGELDLFLNGGIPLYNKLVPSSTVGRRRIAFRNSGNRPHAKTKKAPDPCKPSEAMVKIINFVELPIVCGAHLQSPKLHSSGFPFLSLQKPNTSIVKGMKRKISPSFSEGQGWVKFLSTFSVGLFF